MLLNSLLFIPVFPSSTTGKHKVGYFNYQYSSVFFSYRGQSIILNNYPENGSNHEEFLLKSAFSGQGEKRTRVCACMCAEAVQ